MKILLFGGTFDPPHNGHMNNLRAAIAAVQPDRVIVMPAGTPPHKAASTTPGEIRLEMCRCFEPLAPTVSVWDWEIRRAGKSYTVDTLQMLAERFRGAALFFTIGSDMLLEFTAWHCWQQILTLATLVVQSRTPGDEKALEAAAERLRAEGGRILFAHAAPLPMASRELRSGAADRESLPPPVPALIEKYHLYGG